MPYVPWIIFNKKTKQWLGKCYISDGFMSPHTNTEGKKQEKSSNIGSLTKNNTYQKFQIWYRTESEVDSYKWLLEDTFEFFLNVNFSCTISPSFKPLCVYFPTQNSLNKLVREFPSSCLVHFFKFFGFSRMLNYLSQLLGFATSEEKDTSSFSGKFHYKFLFGQCMMVVFLLSSGFFGQSISKCVASVASDSKFDKETLNSWCSGITPTILVTMIDTK